MQAQTIRPASGHVFLRKRQSGARWYAKYRTPDGRQVQKALGHDWQGKGRPPAGHLNRRMAEAELRALLTDAGRGLGPQGRTGRTVADAVDEWLRYSRDDRGVKKSTLYEYESCARRLNAALGEVPVERLTTERVQVWRDGLVAEGRLTPRTINKLCVNLHAVMERASRRWKVQGNPVRDLERLRERTDPGQYEFYASEEVMALVRAAVSEQDAAIFLTAAFTGLRMGELLALTWRDVDFERDVVRVRAGYTRSGGLSTPKSGVVRSVPMVEAVARALAKLGQRPLFTGDDDLVFPSVTGDHLDGSALRRRYKDAVKRAGLRPIRFHDLRHTFGSLAIDRASIVQVQHWMGHSDSRTTQRYLHHKSRSDEARLLADAFQVATPDHEVERKA